MEERIKKDKKHPGVIIELNKGNMIYDIVALIKYRVITIEDLEDFSDEFERKSKFLVAKITNDEFQVHIKNADDRSDEKWNRTS